MNNLTDDVESAVSRAIRKSLPSATVDAHTLMEEIRSIRNIKETNQFSYRYLEHEIEISGKISIPPGGALDFVRPLDLTCAPIVERVIPAGDDQNVTILRYPACPGEELIPFDSTTVMPSQEAQDQLRRDLRKLAERGLVHPFSRGSMHWLVSSKTGKLLLDSWYCLRPAEPEEIEYLLRRVEGILERRAAKVAKAAAAGSAPTASPDAPTLRTSAPVASNAPAMPAAPARPNADAAGDASARMRQVFGHSRVLLPVIHPIGWEPALDAVRIAVNAGVPGVFLINQGLAAEDVLRLVLEVRRLHPALWVGVNLLGYSPVQALEAALDACEGRIDGLWTDNAGIDERLPPDSQDAGRAFVAARQRLQWTGLYFGGVAFKYQRPVAKDHLPAAAHAAAPYLDLLCTSGPGTGMEAEHDKISTLHRAASPTLPLALASGVTPDNVASYLPFVHAFLVGTGLEHSLGILDPLKVAALQRSISTYVD